MTSTCIYILSRGEESRDNDCWINTPEGGFILKEGSAKRGKSPRGCSGAVSALFLLFRCSESVLCSSGAGRSHVAVCGRNERAS